MHSGSLIPESIICGIGGFETSGEYSNWDCNLFFDHHSHIGGIESSQNQLYPENAQSSIEKLRKENKYYNQVSAITLDCEPFFDNGINNVDFHVQFIQEIDKEISVYINPRNLGSLKREKKDLLQKFMETLGNKEGKILLPSYSYDRDSPRNEDIIYAINICNDYGVKHELIFDTKQSNKLSDKIHQLKGIEGVNFSSFTIFSLEID